MFNVRVYGILIEDSKVLVTDEYRMRQLMTKFPGGGLEFGEGTIDCIKREAIEEFGQAVEVIAHFYTTDFFQASAFDETQQLISIYYQIKTLQPFGRLVATSKFDFSELTDGAQAFRWIALKDLVEDDVTFPIDKKVVGLIKDTFC